MADESSKRRRGGATLLALLGLLLGGAGAYGAVSTGLVDAPRLELSNLTQRSDVESWPTPSFVELAPMVISLGRDAGARHLRLSLQLEVAPGTERSVQAVVPRILDVLNTYLRAVDGREIEVAGAMLQLKSQMLRRVQLVSPPESVRDLLVQEFIIN